MDFQSDQTKSYPLNLFLYKQTIHSLHCKDYNAPGNCDCLKHFMSCLFKITYFDIIIVTKEGKHVSYCSQNKDFCNCQEGNFFLKIPRLLNRGSDGKIHISNCNLQSCNCIQKLFQCGYYKIRLSENGTHLTHCKKSVDSPCFESCQCVNIFQQTLSFQNITKPKPIYIWKFNDAVHLLNCNLQDCNCSIRLEEQLSIPFVLLFVTSYGTHLTSCNNYRKFCDCNLLSYVNFKHKENGFHRSDCFSHYCDCKHLINQPWTPMPPRGKLLKSLNNLLFLPNTQNCVTLLFECEYYKIRLSEHGYHLTHCEFSIDGPILAKCDCNEILKQLSAEKNLEFLFSQLTI